MPPLRSQSLADAEYEPSSQTLTIAFHNGRSYTYDSVPAEIYEGLMAAPSPGAYYNTHIKGIYG